MADNQEKIFCPTYEVWNSRYACARRYENANQVTGNPYDKGGPGCGDLACRECEIGKRLAEAGEGKKIFYHSIKNKAAVVNRPKEVGMGEEKMAVEASKGCNKCLAKKQLSEFAINRATKDGLDYYCKQCRAEERRNKKRGGKPAKRAVKKTAAPPACVGPGPVMMTTKTPVRGAGYYDAGGMVTLEIIQAKLTAEQYLGFLLGNCIKYSCRMNHKGERLRDAEKAAMYAAWLAEAMGGKKNGIR